MITSLRGNHNCYICGNVLTWAADIQKGPLVLHGSEVAAEAVAQKRLQPSNQVEFTVKLECPKCGCCNQLKSNHTIV